MKRYEIVIFIPVAHGDQVRQAMGDAGAGRLLQLHGQRHR
jgi:hypothetical protein